jgi:SH3-like domain-containing protein
MVRRRISAGLFAAIWFAAAAAFMSGSPPAAAQQSQRSWEGSISARSLNVRAGPGEGHEIVAKLGRGDKVVAFDRDGRWVSIREFDDAGTIGWVHRSFVRLPDDFMAPLFGDAENAFLEWASERGDLSEVSVDADDRLSLVLADGVAESRADAVARAVACEWRTRLSIAERVIATVWPPAGPAAGWISQVSCP